MRKLSFYSPLEDVCHYLYIDDEGNAAYERYDINKELQTDHLNNLSEEAMEEWLSNAYEAEEEELEDEETFLNEFIKYFDVHSDEDEDDEAEGTAIAAELTFKDFVDMMQDAVKEVADEFMDVNIRNVEVEHDSVPYQEGYVDGPGYISGMDGEIELHDTSEEFLFPYDEMEGHFEEEDWLKIKEFIKMYPTHEDYKVDIDVSGRYNGDSSDVGNYTFKFKFDENGNLVWADGQDSIAISSLDSAESSFDIEIFDIQTEGDEFFGYKKLDSEEEATKLEEDAMKSPEISETVRYFEDGQWHVGVKGPLH